MKKRAHFTLVEILIACFLLGILLTFLFAFLKQNLSAKQKLESVKELFLQTELFKVRLTHLFTGFDETEGNFVKTITHANAVGPALLIYSDLGIASDSSFSGKRYSMLFITQDQRLCLCHWSKEKTPKVDTLLTKLHAFSLSFFSEEGWCQQWPKNKKSHASPLMLKISLTFKQKDTPQDFIFFLAEERGLHIL